MEHSEKEPMVEKQPLSRKKKALIGLSVLLVVVLAGFAAGGSVLHAHYNERILPNTFVGPIDLGGLTKQEAQDVLETWQQQWWSNQLQYSVQDEQGRELTSISFFPLIVIDAGEGNSQEFIWYDVPAMVDQAYMRGKASSLFSQFVREMNFGHKITLQPVVEIDETQLEEVLALELASFETLPVNAELDWRNATSEPKVVSEQQGNIFDYQKAIADTREQLIAMEIGEVVIHRKAAMPEIDAEHAQKALASIDSVKEQFPLTLVYQDPVIDLERSWTVHWNDIYKSIQPLPGEEMVLGLAHTIDSVWEDIEEEVNAEAENARFEIDEETKKVQQFQTSSSGYMLQREETLNNINQALKDLQEESIKLAVQTISPEVKTAEVNDLGITEILGVGYSSFAGSPRNRVHNIRVGVEKLNGLLIAPDETFSLLAALRPFTLSGGYLPELVIKGDKITPEIGGGLCQIGSTTFRAAMKAGLDIVERRNHSLVVNYYNDPRNGKPGTDATIYDSSPDFKFANDTGNYILLKTEMNAATGDLWFTFWGASDGRKADYSEPVVHNWVGAGPTKYIDSTDLAPGEQKCQGAHPGASTSFTYTVERPDGTLEEEVFSSSYRPLPTICLVGVDPNAPSESEEEVVEGEEVTTTEEITSSEPATEETQA